ncbi:TIGR03809 family protein [Bradyrhizobium sp. CSA112]|uniref:TIGR03809 family protein n=1 Tax=Bradyrhizobium sp. CSA112 TaxID=2699170 RepID=UPI0023AEDACD|nr:TIGR03809 family protein [Bradyrhizobium sp. CSA112]MDE5451362.1 TIGR03809 family protein [Bradyrhizobium sp. CSA112]
MAHPADVARGRNIVARWCNLAEQRLEYLTELFETGRWRRYHTEVEFLENIQEAKAAVETWRDLLSQEAALDNTAIDMAWLGRRRTTPMLLTPLPRDEGFRQPVVQLQPAPVAAAPPRDVPADVLVALESQLVAADEAPSVPDAPPLDEMPLPALSLDVMKERYPLLRNAL